MNRHIDWDNIAATFFWVIVSVIFIVGIKAITFNHVVRSYYLNSTERRPIIKADINWAEDRIISLPDSISFPEAIKMIEDLNKSLVK